MKQTSGHTLMHVGIDSPDMTFIVTWDSPEYHNVLRFKAETRWAKVLARTKEKALEIAQYHHYRGRNFHVLVAPK